MASFVAALAGVVEVTEEPAQATFPVPARQVTVLRPRSRDQVVACVRLAREHGVELHPISGGMNHGYGSRAPRGEAAVIDLAGLNRIVDFDESLAYVTLEPGVTFRQLARYLNAVRADVFASVTGGPADGSVIANALARGDGSGPLGDRWASLCALEVVLPSGQVIETGFGRYGGATVPLSAWGVGPTLDGLFSQSAMGIVTRATVWLTPVPRTVSIGWWTADDLAIVEPLRDLRMRGIATSTVSIWNELKLRSIGVPADRPWGGVVTLYGQSEAHDAALRELAIEAVPQLRFVEADPGPTLGEPGDHNLVSMKSGFLWLSHAVPFTRAHADRAAAICAGTSTALLGVTPRLLSLVVALAWERGDEDDAMMREHDRLFDALVAAGYPPFRTGIQRPAPPSEPYDRIVAAIAAQLAAPTTSSRR